MKRSSPAALRNREPIAEVLMRVLPSSAVVLHIAEGSGEHVTHFAGRFPGLEFLPSDPSAEARASIDTYVAELGLANVRPAIELDVLAPWPVKAADVVVCINMLHASVPETLPALMRGAAAVLPPGGRLVTYGAYKIGGAFSGPGDVEFDAWLKERNPRWGVRDLEAVVAEAEASGLTLSERIPMPAGNFTLVFTRR